MQYKFTFKHMEALESIEDYAKHRIEKLNKFSLHKEPRMQFFFESRKRTEFKAEILFNAGRTHYTSSCKDKDLYTAIDKAVAKLEKQLAKHKEKVQKHHPHHGKSQHNVEETNKDVASHHSFDMFKKAN